MGLDAAIEGSIGMSLSDFICAPLRWPFCCPSCRIMDDGLVACAIPAAPPAWVLGVGWYCGCRARYSGYGAAARWAVGGGGGWAADWFKP